MSKLSQKNKSQANCLTSSRTISRWQISLYIRLVYSLIGLDFTELENMLWGSGCGSVGRAVSSDTRGPRFKSSHRQNLY